jgi:Protein kinase domain
VATDLQVGEELGGFRIESVIGRGGMGVVYLARDLTLDRMAALKVVIPELADDPEFRERFIREARLAASLDHPNIIPIHHAGEVGGRLYIAMRYVSSDLRTQIDAGAPLEPKRALELLDQAASGLDAAHRRGLVHRDVKPANILIEPATEGSDAERAFLTDFGLVKHLDSATRLTRSGMFLGTLEYAAPEQLQGKTLGGRTDQYALGCILFECLSGTPPYEAETEAQMMYSHVFEPPPKLSERRPDLPRSLDDVLARAMAKQMEDRYANCVSLVAAARGKLAGPRTAYAPPPMPRAEGATEAVPPPMPVPPPDAPPAPAAAATEAPAPDVADTVPPSPAPDVADAGAPAPAPAPARPPAPAPARAPERTAEPTGLPPGPSMTPAAVVVAVGVLLLLAGLAAPIRKDVGVSLDANKAFFQERLWHQLEPVLVPLLAIVAVLLVAQRLGPRRFFSGALVGFGIAETLRNVQLLASVLGTAPEPGIFIRLAGALVLLAGGLMAVRRSRRDREEAPAPRDAGRGGVGPVLWGLGAAFVVVGLLVPALKSDELGRSLTIIAPHDSERTWFWLEPMILAVAALGAAAWWWLGRPDRQLLTGLVAGAGVALALHLIVYVVASSLVPGFTPEAGAFLGLGGGILVAVGALLALRRVRAAPVTLPASG